jgi:hypothetical protein
MASIPTSIFGIVGFIALAAILIGYLDSSDTTSTVSVMNAQISKDTAKIQTASNTTASTDWLSSITNTGNIIFYGFNIIVSFILYPFLLFANLLITIGLLPADMQVIGMFIGIGVISAIAIFIRRG